MKKIGSILLFVFAVACKQKNKEKDKTETFFPVLSFIKSQVAHVDTSFYQITKLIWLDSLHTDTAYMRREDFRGLAKDFLEIPDISDKKYKNQYTEEKFYDEELGRVSLTYKPKDPNNAIIQLQEVQIAPDPYGDKVKNFYIHLVISNRDSSIEKKMLWQVDKLFQVVTIVQKPGQPEVEKRFKVIWNEEE